MKRFLQNWDFFGYTPQFLTNGSKEHKTYIGGITTIIFIVISLVYFISQFYRFLQNYDIVKDSRNFLKPSPDFTITPNDLYFGIGFLDDTSTEKNISEYPYLQFNFKILSSNSTVVLNGTLGPCDINKFLSECF